MNLKEKINDYREKTKKTLPQIADEAKVSLKNLYQLSRGLETDMTDECKRLIAYIDGIQQIGNDDKIPNRVRYREKPKPVTPLAIKIFEFQQSTGKNLVEIATESGVPKENLYKWSRNVVPKLNSDYERIAIYLNQIGNEIEIIPGGSLTGRIDKLMQKSGKTLKFISGEANVLYDTLYKWWKKGIIPRGNEQYKRFLSYLERMEIIFSYSGKTIGEIIGTKCDEVVQVIGDSMEPTFKPGSKLAVSQVSNPKLIIWGDYHYIVYKDSNSLIRRIYPMSNADSLRLEADQIEKYPSVIQSWNEIESVYKIHAVITLC